MMDPIALYIIRRKGKKKKVGLRYICVGDPNP